MAIAFRAISDNNNGGGDEFAVGKRLFEGELTDNINRLQKAAHGRID